jgi:hypothetical protein
VLPESTESKRFRFVLAGMRGAIV